MPATTSASDCKQGGTLQRRSKKSLRSAKKNFFKEETKIPPQSTENSVNLIVQYLAIAVATIWLVFFSGLFSRLAFGGIETGGWNVDTHEDILLTQKCDIDKIHEKYLNLHDFNSIYSRKKPIIIQGLVDKWPAKIKWRKKNLSDVYGNRFVKVSSGSDIVMSAGGVANQMSISEFIEKMETDPKSENLFTFDVDFLKNIPELKLDFTTPEYFKSWEPNPNSEWEPNQHFMFSLGSSRNGLPFHYHGETWIGLVYGIKRWFIFPPGKGLSSEINNIFHPHYNVWQWYKKVYPNLPKEEQPLEFIQYPGDIVYLPPGWKHMTMNIGETIGVGVQDRFAAEDRLKNSIEVLERNPNDVEAHHGMAIGLASRAIELLDDRRPNFQLDGQLFKDLMGRALQGAKTAISLRPLQIDLSIMAAEIMIESEDEAIKREAITLLSNVHYLYASNELCKQLPGELLSTIYMKFGKFFLYAKELPYAKESFQMATEFQYDNVDALVELSRTLKLLDDVPNAKVAFEKAVKYAPQNHPLSKRKKSFNFD